MYVYIYIYISVCVSVCVREHAKIFYVDHPGFSFIWASGATAQAAAGCQCCAGSELQELPQILRMFNSSNFFEIFKENEKK